MKTIFRKWSLILFLISTALQAAPVWNKDIIKLPEANEGEVLTVDLNRFASSSSGRPLIFQFMEKPAFLTLSHTGILTGTPRRKDVGRYVFRIAALDGEKGSIATFDVTIAKVKYPAEPAELICASGQPAHLVGATADHSETIYSCKNAVN